MASRRDDVFFAQLRQRPENRIVLDVTEVASAHGDLSEVVFRFARLTGAMRVEPVATADFPAFIATRADSDLIVVAATGMSSLFGASR